MGPAFSVEEAGPVWSDAGVCVCVCVSEGLVTSGIPEFERWGQEDQELESACWLFRDGAGGRPGLPLISLSLETLLSKPPHNFTAGWGDGILDKTLASQTRESEFRSPEPTYVV